MKAIVYHGVGDIRLETVEEPTVQQPTDAIVRLTASAICGTDLHLIRGTLEGMIPGTILGHEGVGVVEEVGPGVRNLRPGDRVVIPSSIACGNCVYCRAGYYSQCNQANPRGSGTAFFGGPEASGSFPGLQAEYARVPFSNVGLVKLPEEVDDEQAILLSDIFPTGFFGAHLAELHPGDTLAIFGCGPVGQFAIASAKLLGAGRIFAVDALEDRLEMAASQGAETIDFSKEDPVAKISELTSGIGVDRSIDAVGVDATSRSGASPDAQRRFDQEVAEVAPHRRPTNGSWQPGNAPSQALEWAVESLAKAGTLSVIGVYPPALRSFPIGVAMNKNLTIRMGNCNHRRYLPELIGRVVSGQIDPATILTQQRPFDSALDAYRAFDRRELGWMKVELQQA